MNCPMMMRFALMVMCVSTAAADEWTPPECPVVDMQGSGVVAGSVLDLTDCLPKAEAGLHGRIRRGASGHLEFADRPGVPVRLRGFNADPSNTGKRFFVPKEEAERFVTTMRMMGYNAIRIPFPLVSDRRDGDGRLFWDQDKLDRFDYLMSKFKAAGIAVEMLPGPGCFGSGQWDYGRKQGIRMRLFLGDEVARRQYRENVTYFLDHVNPYTGLSYRDEPILLAMEWFNEQEIGLWTWKSIPEDWKAAYTNRFNAYHAARVAAGKRDDPELSRAHFNYELERDCAKWYRDFYAQVGWKGLATYCNLGRSLYGMRTRFEFAEMMSDNSYQSHPIGDWQPGKDGRPSSGWVPQESTLGSGGRYAREVVHARASGRPAIITEHNNCFWNAYEYEGALYHPAFCAMQGIDGTFVHETPVALWDDFELWPFFVAGNPVMRANEFLAAMIFGRGDARPARHRIALDIDEETFERFAGTCPDPNRLAVGLVTGLCNEYTFVKSPWPLPKADLHIPAGTGAPLVGGEWFARMDEGKSASEACSLEAVERLLRTRGILPEGNRTDLAKRRYEFETGEGYMDSGAKFFELRTARTEGVSGLAGKRTDLPHLSTALPVDATVAITSRDGRDLSDCRHAVLCLITRVFNTGMRFADGKADEWWGQRAHVVELGKSPVRMVTGRFELALRGFPAGTLTVRSVSVNGVAREPIPVRECDGVRHVTIDTAALAHGPTPFFEILVKAADE